MSRKTKTTSTSNQTSNVVATPTNPQWVEDSAKGLQTRINGLLDTDPSTLVPGASPLQQAAFAGASRLMPGGGAPQAQPAMGGGGPMMGSGGPGWTPPAQTEAQPPGPAPAGQKWAQGPEGWALVSDSSGSFADRMGGLFGDKGGAGPPPIPTDANGFASKAADRASSTGVPRTAAPTMGASIPQPAMTGWRDGNAMAQGAAAGLLDDEMTAAAPVSAERVASERAASERVNAQQAGTYMADASPRVNAGSLLDVDLERYQNPWEDAVVDSTLGNFDEQSGMQRAQLAAQQARGQKFSGSGSAIERALFERGNVRDRAGTEAGLRSAGFDRATGLATQDLDRRAQVDLTEAQRLDSMSRGNADRFTQNNQFNAGQVNSVGVSNAGRADEIAVNNASRGDQVAVNNASRADELALDAARRTDAMTLASRTAELGGIGLLGDLANAGGANMRADDANARDWRADSRADDANARDWRADSRADDANERADLGLLADLGAEERQIAGQQAMAEPALLQIISALNQGQPYDLFKGATTNSTSSGTQTSKGKESGFSGSDLAQMAAAAVMASDRRLKTDVEKIGKDRAGRNMYEFRYKGEPKRVRHTGYMAQEIERTEPRAVFKGPGGYKMINLGLLEDPA